VEGKLDLSLVLPCYNDGSYLDESVGSIRDTLDLTRISYELILVDDGSTDDTRDIIERFAAGADDARVKAVFHESNQGRGAAVATGFKTASGEVLGYIDVDLEVHPCYVPACYAMVRSGADCVLARRIYKVSVRRLHRHLASWGYKWLRKRMIGGPDCDTESGYKFFKRDVILPVLDAVRDKHWFWDTEVIMELYRRGCSIRELPCLFVGRSDGGSSVRLVRDTIRYLRNLRRFRRELGGRI